MKRLGKITHIGGLEPEFEASPTPSTCQDRRVPRAARQWRTWTKILPETLRTTVREPRWLEPWAAAVHRSLMGAGALHIGNVAEDEDR
ncbi:hypothetical protein HBB16_11965 [Pseudonocardia sp. MCCB 268]|nr:hypothetical protein [Pseudonocardia cytotoxica]